jgi:phenylacetate-coenzyme A ligase PaaK-like adenylate-forming protein
MLYEMDFIASFLKYLKIFKKHENVATEHIDEFRNNLLENMIKHAVKKSGFYKDYYKDVDINKNFKLEDLPIMNKKVFVENFDSIITKKNIKYRDLGKYFERTFHFDNRYLDKYLAFHTSGSTGNPSYVLWGPEEFGKATAAYFYKLSKLHSNSVSIVNLKNKIKVAYIGILNDYVGGNSWAYAMRYLCNLKMISAFQPIDSICDELNEFQPDIIMTKPTILGQLARKQRDKKLRIKPNKIIYAGEMIQPGDQNDIKKYFLVNPYNSYSTCETGPVAIQMSNEDGLDIYNEMVYVELLDENNKPIKEYNKVGKIVITNLYNKTVPIIRYDIGDSAYFINDNAKMEFSQLSNIIGRTTSFFNFYTKSGDKVKVPEFPFWAIYEKGITRYQVQQESNCKLILKLEWDNTFYKCTDIEKEKCRKSIINKVCKIIESYSADIYLNIVTEDVKKILPNKSGKIKITQPLK